LGGGREKEKFGRVFTGAHTTISFDILYSMIEKPLDPQRYFVEDTALSKWREVVKDGVAPDSCASLNARSPTD